MHLHPKGDTLDLRCGDDGRIFGGLKFSIPGFFHEGKFWQIFLGWLDLSRNFWGIINILKICGSALAA